MQKPRLLIADAVDSFRMALAEELAPRYRIRCCQNGKEALELIRTFEPDAVVIDLTLPEVDGISVLLKAAELGARPIVLATTRFLSEYVSEMVTRLGVGYVMLKPCDVRTTAERLGDLTQHMKPLPVSKPDMQTIVSNVLLSLSFPAKLRGYTYLREALPRAIGKPGQMITKEIYPEVARICGVSQNQVERGIRSAIESAFARRDDRVWSQYFNMEGMTKRPSNGDFLLTLAAKLAGEEQQEGNWGDL